MEDTRQAPPTTPSHRMSQPGSEQQGFDQAGSWAASKVVERTTSVASSDSARLSLDSFNSSIISVGADARRRGPLHSTSGFTHKTRRLSLTARDAALFTASQVPTLPEGHGLALSITLQVDPRSSCELLTAAFYFDCALAGPYTFVERACASSSSGHMVLALHCRYSRHVCHSSRLMTCKVKTTPFSAC